MDTPKAFLFGGAAEYFRRLVGGDVEPVEASPTVGVASAEAVGSDPERVQLTMVNLSANTVYVRPNRPASSGVGILLAPNGGSLSMTAAEDGTLPSQAWHAIATGAASALYVTGLRRINQEG